MFTKKDLAQYKNLQRLLGKSKFLELDPQEILAAADVFRWLANLEPQIISDIQTQEAMLKLAEVNPPISEPVLGSKKKNKT